MATKATKAELRARLVGSGKDLVRRERVRLTTVTDEHGQPLELEVRGLMQGRVLEIKKQAMDADGKLDDAKLYPALLIESLYVPGTDDRLLSAGDRDAVLDWPAEMAEQLAAVAMEVSGLGLAGFRAVEKNSDGATTTASTSVAPSSSPSVSA